MFNTFKEYLNCIQSDGGFLLCVYYKSIDSPQSTSTHKNPRLMDIMFKTFYPLNRSMSLGHFLKKLTVLGVEFDYIAMSETNPCASLYEANLGLNVMCDMLREGEGAFLTIRKDGTLLNPSEDETVH